MGSGMLKSGWMMPQQGGKKSANLQIYLLFLSRNDAFQIFFATCFHDEVLLLIG